MFDDLKDYYTDYERTTMQPHEERVVAEQKELAEKLVKLREFIRPEKPLSTIFTGLSRDEQERLKAQEFHMSMYWQILQERINNFPA